MTATRPSLDRWLAEMKALPGAERVGMYLVHNGVVRGHARDGSSVCGMELEVDRERLEEATEAANAREGIAFVRAWVGEGTLTVGDDIMYVLVAGDIRENVFGALQDLVRTIKTEVVVERES